jgi:hypothetical protein
MASIELSTEEMSLVAKVLESRLSRLVTEINHSDSRNFREDLKQQALSIEDILLRLHKDPARKLA